MYYAQFGEDKILSEIFKDKVSGLCIEVGANDGIHDSNTMYFENIGWDCILIEPNPLLCKTIRASRKSIVIEAAVSNIKGETTLFVAEGAERAHGVSTINSDRDSLSKIKSYGFNYNEVQVKVRTLDDILDSESITRSIDFVSVDVEGHELNVFKGFSLDRWKPKIILVEDNSNFMNSDVRDFLKKYGYYRFLRTGVNDWYAHKSNIKLINVISRFKFGCTKLNIMARNTIIKVQGVEKIVQLIKKHK